MSNIEWTQKVWNPTVGCTKISPGCENCYAINMANRLQGIGHSAKKYEGTVKKTPGGKLNWTGKINLDEVSLVAPLSRKKPTTYFVNSMSDIFHENVPFDFVDKIFAVMALCPHHTFQILTKRADRMERYFKRDCEEVIQAIYAHEPFTEWEEWEKPEQLPKALSGFKWSYSVGRDGFIDDIDLEFEQEWVLPNVHLGVSIENQKTADDRVPPLLRCPAAIHWVSMEPSLGYVAFDDVIFDGILFNSLTGIFDLPEIPHPKVAKIDWVVMGGESGSNARPMHPDWARSIRDQCKESNTPFFFKQWGAWQDGSNVINKKYKGKHLIVLLDGTSVDHKSNAKILEHQKKYTAEAWNKNNPCVMSCVGKHAAGRLLDGVLHDEYPVKK